MLYKGNPLIYNKDCEIDYIKNRIKFLDNMKKEYVNDKKLSLIELKMRLQIINIIKIQYNNDLDKLKFLN